MGLGGAWFLIASLISEVATAASAAASMRYWSNEAVMSANSSAVLVILTAEPCRSLVVRCRSIMVDASCSVAGCIRFVMASAALAAVLSMLKLSRISTVALRLSTTFDNAVVWDRRSRAILRFAGLYSSPVMTRYFLSRYSFAVFSSYIVLIVALSSSSCILPAVGFTSFLVLPHVPGFLVVPTEKAIGYM